LNGTADACFYFSETGAGAQTAGMEVVGNSAVNCGNSSFSDGEGGYAIDTGYTTLTSNTATNTAADGFTLAPYSTTRTNITLTGNTATGTLENGFYVTGYATNVTLDGNHATKFGASGFNFRSGATFSDVSNNTAGSGGDAGLCDAAGAFSGSGNSFGSSAFPTDCTRSYGYSGY
jgi:hypothetical protein